MRRSAFAVAWAVAWIAASSSVVGADEPALGKQDATADEVITALEKTYGVHAGQRRNHTKGVCALGTFEGLKAAGVYSRSPLFTGQRRPVVARFSLAGGDPNASDADRSPRGMALEFRLPDGRLQHMNMLDTPMFFAATPRTFLDRIRALEPDPKTGKPDPARLQAFLATHPEAQGQARYLAAHNPPASYANESYFGIHTFKLIDARGKATLVRWRFVPQDGARPLTDDEMKTRPRDFLAEALRQRTKAGPVRWDMWLTIGEPGDVEDNPTVLWPSGRKEIRAGTLTLDSVGAQPGRDCETINYDPLILGDGFAATNDPILLARSLSYAVSMVKRAQGL